MRRLASFALLSLLLLLVVTACQDRSTPAGLGQISAAISDGAHGDGNRDFFFLPPLVGDPSSDPNFEPGAFNALLRPWVRVYPMSALSAECTVRSDDPAPTPAYDAPVPAVPDEEMYRIEWDTDALSAGAQYRLCVFSSATGATLGFLDLEPVTGGVKNLRTGEIATFQQGRVIPVKFRIEHGALCADPGSDGSCTEFTVSSEGGDFTLPSDYAALSIPAGAIAGGDVVTVIIEKQLPPDPSGKCLPGDLEQALGCYHYRTEPELYPFGQDVRIEICVDAGAVSDPSSLLVHKYNPTEGLVALPRAEPTLIDCTGFQALNETGAEKAPGILQRLGRWANRLLAPRDLYAAILIEVPKGIGGLAGSFSDVGGAVPDVPPGVVSWWKGENDALDLYGLNNGVLMNGASFAPGIVGTAFSFNSLTLMPPYPFVKVPEVAVLDTLQRLTVEAWVRMDSVLARYPGHNQRFVTIAPERVVLRQDLSGPAQAHFFMNFGTSTVPAFEEIRADNVLTEGCFEHVVGTYDGAQMRLYVNATLVGTHDIVGTVAPGATQLDISSEDELTTGEIDEVRVFNRALTPAEIQAIYDAGSALLKCAPLGGILPPDVSSSLAFTGRSFGSAVEDIYRLDSGAVRWVNLTADPDFDYFTPAWSPDGSQLAFSSDRAGGYAIWLMDRSGAGVTQLTDTGYNAGPNWSPLGDRIAFSQRDADWSTIRDVAVIGTDASGRTALTSGVLVLADSNTGHDPTYPGQDGGMWIGQTYRSHRGDLARIDLLLSVANITTPVSTTVSVFRGSIAVGQLRATAMVSVSPPADGEEVRWVSYEFAWPVGMDAHGDTTFTIGWSGDASVAWIYSSVNPYPLGSAVAASGVPEPGRDYAFMAYGTSDDFHPAWSPDGTKIAFTSDRSDNYDIWVMNSDGSALRQLTFGAGWDFDPAWSPTGDRIVFACESGGQYDICLIDPDGTNLAKVTDDAIVDSYPVWSGGWIAFERYVSGSGGDIFLIRPDGTGLQRVTDGSMDFRQPAWPLPPYP